MSVGIGAMTSLIHPNGSLNESGIMAEIDRRCSFEPINELYANRRIYHERRVCQEAAGEQWSILRPLIDAEWTDDERSEYHALHMSARHQPVNADGNVRFKDLSASAEAIHDRVRARAIAKAGIELLASY